MPVPICSRVDFPSRQNWLSSAVTSAMDEAQQPDGRTEQFAIATRVLFKVRARQLRQAPQVSMRRERFRKFSFLLRPPALANVLSISGS